MPDSRTRHYLFLAIALVCFAIGLLLAVDVFDGDQAPWLAGGLLAFAAAHLP